MSTTKQIAAICAMSTIVSAFVQRHCHEHFLTGSHLKGQTSHCISLLFVHAISAHSARIIVQGGT